MRVTFVPIVLALAVLALPARAQQTQPDEQPVALKTAFGGRPRHMSISEDGRMLVLSVNDQVVLWDIVKGTKAGEVTMAGPVGALIRGDKLIAGSGSTGVVCVFDAKTLAPLFNVETAVENMYNLSAARASAFDGKVFVSGRGGLYLVDIDKKTSMEFDVPPQRRSAKEKTRVYVGPGGKTLQYGSVVYRMVQKDGKWSLVRLGDLTAPHSDPYLDSSISLGREAVYELGGLAPIMQKEGAIFIPDAALPVFYCLDKTRLECRVLDARSSPVGAKPVVERSFKYSPADPSASLVPLAPASAHLREVMGPDYPVAVTIGKDLFIFVVGATGVWSARTGAFDTAIAKAGTQPGQAAPLAVGELLHMPVEGPVRQMDMSEDGKSLFLSLTELDKVLVLDVVTGKPVASLSCKAPGALLCRGRKLFVGGQDGTVAVFSLDDWKTQDQLSAGKNPVVSLSAPGGKYFQGKLLACDGKNNYLVDSAADRATLLKETGQCRWSYVGNIIYPGGFSGGPPERPAKEVLAEPGGTLQPPPKVARESFSWTDGRQYHEQSQWRRPWFPLGEERKQFIKTISDVTAPVLHVLYEDKVTTLRLEDDAVLGIRPVTRNITVMPGRPRTDAINMAVAATLDGVTYVYAGDSVDGRLYRLVLPAGAADVPSGPFPAGVEIGKPLRHKLPDAPAGPAEYAVERGPDGIRISADGTLDWTPAATDAGEHDLKIRVKKGDDVSFIRLHLAVGPAGDSGLLASMLELSSSGREPCITWSPDRLSMLVVDGMNLAVIGPGGRGVVKRLYPERNYTRVWQRPDGYLATREQSLYVLDQALKEVREINVKEYIRQVVPSPREAVSYVLTDSWAKDAANHKMLYALNEKLCILKPLPKAFADMIAIDPSGQFLFATFNNRGSRGYFVGLWGGVWEVREANHVLVAYSADGMSLRPSKAVQLQRTPDRIAVSSNGERIGVRFMDHWLICDRGLKFTGKDIQARITEMHPYLPLGLVKTDRGLQMANMEGQDVTDKLDQSRIEDGEMVYWAMFCPDGRHVLVGTGKSGRMGSRLRSLPLKLSSDELAAISKAAPVPVTAAPPAGTVELPPRPDATAARQTSQPASENKTVARKELDSLALPRPTKDLTAKDIGRQYMDSVVVIRAGSGSGTGFVVGGDGYILTCDHVLGGSDKVMVWYRSDGSAMSGATGQVIARDAVNDLALLKIPMQGKLPAVPLAAGKPQAGENVTVIGHPGLGAGTLDYTLTSGIVSQADHKIEGLSYIQTTATINPGNSGGPMFDGKGCLLGAVVLKDVSAEKRSFVIGPERIKAFLERCTTEVK